MNISSVNSKNMTENKVSQVNSTEKIEKVEKEKQAKDTVMSGNKKVTVEATKDESKKSTYNASGKLNDNTIAYAQSIQAQAQQPQVEKTTSSKNNDTSQKVQAVSKSIDTRA